MTAKEKLSRISGSSLWKIRSIKEKLEAIAYKMTDIKSRMDDEDVSDIIGEVYEG
jgi:hypothetical protein